MKLLTSLNPEGATEEEIATYEVRTAVRAVVSDDNGNVAILSVSKWHYHKLPGGGVEEGEDLLGALKRECLEELGCDIEVTGEIGEIIECRKIFKLKQISPCYRAKVIGRRAEPSSTQEELDDGFQILWLHREDAIARMDTDQPKNPEGTMYIVPRDRMFLVAAGE